MRNCVTENGTTYTDPFEYLDDFFAACPDCRVDYIAVHCYMNTVSALQWYIGEFKKYGKPIWLTEFAGWESNGNINNLDDQISFMMGAVDFLETDPDVFRYSWFIGRGGGIANYPYIDILGANGALTELGKVYKQMPVHDADKVIDIPARIEAEEYNTMSGILLEKTKDENGFANVGYIDAGDWLEYKINVPADDNYAISFRVASTKNSTINILFDGTNKLTQNFGNSGGWQTWTTANNNVNLTKGAHTLRLQAVTDGFNLNWFQIGDVVSSLDKHDYSDEFVVYPNPSIGVLKIKTSCKVTEIVIYDLNGNKVMETSFNETLNLRKLSKGVYILKALNRGTVLAARQIVLE
ncbi:MAG: carbohydrate-binding protein [Chloroflexia bacterium]|nr:carbohydrate-binding protein [Chloroflexia bacterium]